MGANPDSLIPDDTFVSDNNDVYNTGVNSGEVYEIDEELPVSETHGEGSIGPSWGGDNGSRSLPSFKDGMTDEELERYLLQADHDID